MDYQANRFVESISAEAIHSAAVNHKYLAAVKQGGFPNLHLALQDFAFQYGLYTANFSQYVSTVIATLSEPKHKQILLANLAEEQGATEGVDLASDVLASIVGRPHSSLYRRFQLALGVDADYAYRAQPCDSSQQWGQRFLALCKMNECVGIGAIGIGTELIVSRIYGQILEGLRAHTPLTPIEHVFFDLHSQCDEEHAAQMLLIAKDLARDATARKQMAYGARMAMQMRIAFWDEMFARAQNFSATNPATLEKLTAHEY